MKGKLNNNKFMATIDSGSSVTSFTTKALKDIFRTDVFFPRPLPQSQKYVDFDPQPLNFAGFIQMQRGSKSYQGFWYRWPSYQYYDAIRW